MGASHQQRPLEEASKAARLDPAATFHILRHTYASALAFKGVPMGVIAEGEKILKIIKPVDAAFGEKDMTGFLISHGADETPISGGNGCIKGCAFRFVVENGYQRRCINDDHRGKPKSS
jgi:hypothetical protein